MTQIVSLLDAYAFQSLVMAIFVERIRAPQRGQGAALLLGGLAVAA